MGYLAEFRQSLYSFLTPRKTPCHQSQPQPTISPTSTVELHAQSLSQVLQRRSMSPSFKTQNWLSSTTPSTTPSQLGGSNEEENELISLSGKQGYPSSKRRGIMETPHEAYKNFMQLPTPAASGLKRRLGFERAYLQEETVGDRVHYQSNIEFYYTQLANIR
ncbi:hypothetical protein ACJ72_04738 [Emergomyces africanus]|uniref:Uncharacterized protein n=1 Tax=Emergomyces africanus TaxID=1955775 RepID=A0A1B7NVX3_9EURO|nr:hypothetical protein ACJ72_04738 [Emergomyces africanus]